MSYTLVFGQMKGLIEIHNAGNFYHYNICGCQVVNFQRFSLEQKVEFLAASGWFFKDYSPNSSPICTKNPPAMQCNVTHCLYYGF